MRDGLLALVVDVALAVAPESDLVEVLELFGLGCTLQRLEQVVVDVDIIRKMINDIIWIVIEILCVRL